MKSNTTTGSNTSVNTKPTDYEHAHSDCKTQSCCTCTFKFVDYPCTMCDVVMKKLPLKILYCVDCANANKLCPFTFCQ